MTTTKIKLFRYNGDPYFACKADSGAAGTASAVALGVLARLNALGVSVTGTLEDGEFTGGATLPAPGDALVVSSGFWATP